MKKTSLLFVMLMVIFMSTKAQFSENFDAVADGAMPSGWTVFNVDGLTPSTNVSWVTNAWVCKLYGDLPTKAAWSTSWYNPAGTSNDWMFTPAILVPATNPMLTYTVLAQDASYPDGYELRIMTAAPTSGNITTSTVLLTVAAAETSPTVKAIDLTAYAGQTVYIGWRNNSTDMFMLGVDDVAVASYPNNDIALTSINNDPYIASGSNTPITGTVKNMGFNAITSFDVTYTVDGGAPSAVYSVTGVNITTFSSYNFTHNVPANLAIGSHPVVVTISNINGAVDPNLANNVLTKTIGVATQTTTRKPVFEEFTSSTCAPCASFNSGTFTPFITAHGTEFSLIKYQMNWPGDGDPYYTAEGGTRRVYYGVSAVPDLYVDGRPSGSTSATMLSELNADKAKGTFFVISNFTPTYSGTNISVPLTITPYVTGDLKVHVVVVEKTTTGNVSPTSPNGETSWKHVMMDMITGGSGLTVSFTAGTNYTNTFTADMTSTNVEEMSDLTVVVMVQENTTKEIYQSAEADVINTGIDEASKGNISIYPNPAYENITISNAGNSDLMLYDIFGKLVISENHISNNHLLNVSELAKGNYILKLINGDNTITRKIAVIK